MLLNYEVRLLHHNIVYRSYTIVITKSVGPWPVFMAVDKVRTTATAVDKINKQITEVIFKLL